MNNNLVKDRYSVRVDERLIILIKNRHHSYIILDGKNYRYRKTTRPPSL